MKTAIAARYLGRYAIIYVRQSTQQQVRRNEGSRQYQQEQHQVALRYGWPPNMILVVDEDLGLSGMRQDRPGYCKVLKLISEGRVGALFVSDVGRAGRNDRAWLELLELLTKHDVLLFKAGVPSDPSDDSQAFTTKIEALVMHRENQIRRTAMHRGRLAKAGKGKAVSAPPVGYLPVYETTDGVPTKTGAWTKDPDLKIRESIEAVFAAFREMRSLVKTARLLIARGIMIPARRGRSLQKRLPRKKS